MKEQILESLECRRLFNAGTLDKGFDFGSALGFVFDDFTLADIAVESKNAVIGVGTTTLRDEDGVFNTARLVRIKGNGIQDEDFAEGLRINAGGMNSATAVKILPDSTMLVAGQRNGSVAILAKLNRAGKGVKSFDPHGHGSVYLGPLQRIDDILVQSDGKILVAGQLAEQEVGVRGAAVMRLNSDGEIDRSFGENGLASVELHAQSVRSFVAIALDSLGRIVALTDDRSNLGVQVQRFLPDGAVDTQFANDGALDIGPSIDQADPKGLGIQSDDSIVVLAGMGSSGSAIAKYDSDGNPDTGFGTSGVAALPAGIFEGEGVTAARALLVQSDDKLIVGGIPTNSSNDHTGVVARLNADGTLDNSFGHVGIVSHSGYFLAFGPGNTLIAARNGDRVGGQFSAQFFATRIFLDDVPEIEFDGRHIFAPQASSMIILVKYSDSDGIDTSTFSSQNIYLRGAKTFTRNATFDSFTSANTGTEVTVRYKIPAPAGGWTSADNDLFNVVLRENQIKDLTGHFINPQAFGQLSVLIHPS